VAWPLALLGYGWSFATIFPGIFETADLIESFGWFPPELNQIFGTGPARNDLSWRDLSSRSVDRAAASHLGKKAVKRDVHSRFGLLNKRTGKL